MARSCSGLEGLIPNSAKLFIGKQKKKSVDQGSQTQMDSGAACGSKQDLVGRIEKGKVSLFN